MPDLTRKFTDEEIESMARQLASAEDDEEWVDCAQHAWLDAAHVALRYGEHCRQLGRIDEEKKQQAALKCRHVPSWRGLNYGGRILNAMDPDVTDTLLLSGVRCEKCGQEGALRINKPEVRW